MEIWTLLNLWQVGILLLQMEIHGIQIIYVFFPGSHHFTDGLISILDMEKSVIKDDAFPYLWK